jgi:signal transduction histidine kinase
VGADPTPAREATPSPQLSLPPDVRLRWVEFERSTTATLLVVAVVAVLGASLLGLLLAERVVRPLRRLGQAASAVAGGQLSRRSGLDERADEIGDLGRSFDAMAAALEAGEEGRRRFLQDVVHELRTPLTVIDATSTAILDGVYNLEPKHLETIREQTHLLSRIVDDLRTLNLAEIRKLPLELQVLDPVDLLGATATAFEARAGAVGQQVRIEAPGGLAVTGDVDRLRQVLAALTDNALRHTPSGGEIRLRAHEVRGMIRFEVEDTGPGVAPQDLDHVFDRFYEADPARDRAAGHTGLGLAIVKALVEAHGGRAGVENAAGAGARFWFELEAASPPPA